MPVSAISHISKQWKDCMITHRQHLLEVPHNALPWCSSHTWFSSHSAFFLNPKCWILGLLYTIIQTDAVKCTGMRLAKQVSSDLESVDSSHMSECRSSRETKVWSSLQLDQSHEDCVPIKNDCQENVLMQNNLNDPTDELQFSVFSVWGIRSPTHDMQGK